MAWKPQRWIQDHTRGTLPEHLAEMLACAEAADVQAEYRQIGPVAGEPTTDLGRSCSKPRSRSKPRSSPQSTIANVGRAELLLVHVEVGQIGDPGSGCGRLLGLKHRSQVYPSYQRQAPKTRAEVQGLKST